MAGDIFRKASLDRLSSPDKLDQLVTVIGPKGWIAVLGIIGLVIFIIVWSIFGTISIKVQGQGILLRSGGVMNILSLVEGRVTDIAVVPGSFVRRGEIIARISQPKLLGELYISREKINDLRVKYDKTLQHIALQRSNLKTQKKLVSKRLEQRRYLYKKGLISRQQLIDTTEKLQTIRTKLNHLALDEKVEKDALDAAIEKMQTQQDLHYRLSRVISPYTGNIVEVKINNDSLVQSGSGIASMELSGKEIKQLEGIIYVNFSEGKKISLGMPVTLSPSVVKSEEYGSMKGNVVDISPYPVTRQDIMSVLGNEELVNQMLKAGPVFSVTVNLNTDSHTVSGFEWTSEKGPPIKIDSGTLCTAAVSVENRRPISFVLPFFKKTFGI